MGSKMAFNSTALKTTLAAPILAVAFATNAQTKLPVIEPSATDLSKPVAAACVETTPGQPSLTAWDKLKTIMGARGQMIVGSGDAVLQKNARQEMIFTIANNFSGGEAYIVDSATNKADRVNSRGFCFERVASAGFVDNSKSSAIPAFLNKGEMGIVLKNNNSLGSKIAVIGTTLNGSLIAVHFNPDSKSPNYQKGALKTSDAQGNGFRDTAILHNFDYSDKMKAVMVEIAESAKREQAKTK